MLSWKEKTKHIIQLQIMVQMLTKDENITHYIMSYIIDFKYYEQLKNVYNGVLTELLIFNLSWYAIFPRRFHRGKNDVYNKETMLHIHTYLMTHPTIWTNAYIGSILRRLFE